MLPYKQRAGLESRSCIITWDQKGRKSWLQRGWPTGLPDFRAGILGRGNSLRRRGRGQEDRWAGRGLPSWFRQGGTDPSGTTLEMLACYGE